MPGGRTRAARGGEPAGAPTPRGGGYPVATPSQPPCRPVRRLRHGLPACSRPVRRASGRGRETTAPRGRAAVPRGMLTYTRQGEAYRDRVAYTVHDTPGGEGDVVKKPKARLDAWAEAQRRFHLSDLHIQMARELGLNPKKFGGLANHRQEPWKLPLPEFIAEYYVKRFHRERPAKVVPLAEATKRQQQSARDKARHPRARTDT